MTRIYRQLLILTAFTVALLLGASFDVSSSTALACPSCADAMPNGDAGTNATTGISDSGNAPPLAQGFFYSIMFMLVTIFSLFIAVSVCIYRLVQHDAVNNLQAGTSANASPSRM